MTKAEFVNFTAAMRTYYPRENIFPNQQAVELWFLQLQDIPKDVLTLALNAWVATNKWSPSIADLREKAAEITTKQIDDWGDGWEQLQKAIRYYGRYREAEALATMDEVTRQTVQRMGFVELCNSENVTADRANFRQIYQAITERRKKESQIPVNVLALIEQARNGGLTDGRKQIAEN